MTTVVQMTPIGFAQNSPTACGDDTLMGLCQLIEHLLFNVAKAVFAFTGKELPDRAAQLVLDHVVRIDKRLPQAACQLPANGGFARAR